MKVNKVSPEEHFWCLMKGCTELEGILDVCDAELYVSVIVGANVNRYLFFEMINDVFNAVYDTEKDKIYYLWTIEMGTVQRHQLVGESTIVILCDPESKLLKQPFGENLAEAVVTRLFQNKEASLVFDNFNAEDEITPNIESGKWKPLIALPVLAPLVR